MRILVPSALCALLLTACAGAGYNLPRTSARAITPTPHPDSVAITDVKYDRLGTPRVWVATTRSGVYDCSLEPDERTPLCARRNP